ncbi:COG3458 Acetyl esterase (deacetylase) [Fimbriimonadaceae bacterium]
MKFNRSNVSVFALSAVVLAVGCVSVARDRGQDAPVLSATPSVPSATYKVGEKATWTIKSPTLSSVKYTAKRDNAGVVASGTLQFQNGEAKLEVLGDQPSFLYVELAAEGAKPLALAAAISPAKIEAFARPADFRKFWDRRIADARKVSLNPVITPKPTNRESIEYGTYQLDFIKGEHIYGQMAKPKAKGKYPAIIQFQWAGGPYPLDPNWITWRAEQGYLIFNSQAHNVLPTEPKSYYDALPAAIKGYSGIGTDDLENNYFVEMYLRAVRSVDFVTQHPDWDGKTLIVIGTSMGGQQTLAVSGLHPAITHSIANVPAGSDLRAINFNRSASYPFLPVTNSKAAAVAPYVDINNFAQDIKSKVLIGFGWVDTVCAPTGIQATFNAIPGMPATGKKELVPMIDSPHNHQATAAQQKPFVDREAAWLDAIRKGEPISAR